MNQEVTKKKKKAAMMNVLKLSHISSSYIFTPDTLISYHILYGRGGGKIYQMSASIPKTTIIIAYLA